MFHLNRRSESSSTRAILDRASQHTWVCELLGPSDYQEASWGTAKTGWSGWTTAGGWQRYFGCWQCCFLQWTAYLSPRLFLQLSLPIAKSSHHPVFNSVRLKLSSIKGCLSKSLDPLLHSNRSSDQWLSDLATHRGHKELQQPAIWVHLTRTLHLSGSAGIDLCTDSSLRLCVSERICKLSSNLMTVGLFKRMRCCCELSALNYADARNDACLANVEDWLACAAWFEA